MNFIDDLSIRKKILSLVLILIVLQILTSGFGIIKIKGISDEFNVIQKEAIPLTELNTDLTIKQLESEVLIERLLRLSGVSSSKDNIQQVQTKIATLSEEIHQEILAAEEILKKAKTHALNHQLEQEILSLEKGLLAIEQEHTQFRYQTEKLINNVMQDKTVSPQQVIAFEQAEETLNHHLHTMLLDIEKMTEHTIEKVHQDEVTASYSLLIMAVVSTLLGLILSQVITNKITQPLFSFMEKLKLMAEHNDLTTRMDDSRKDEIGQLGRSFNHFSEKLQSLVHNIASASQQLAAAAVETSTVVEQTSHDIHNQNNGTSQVASAINEMTASVKEVAHNAEQASSAASESDQNACNSRKEIEHIVTSIQQLSSEIDNSTEVVSHVKTGSQSISQILDVIINIADQTNLLALNAAIEAARAGEYGRGFAVVAEEVRALAQKTQASTHEIESLINNLQIESDDAVSSMQQNKQNTKSLAQKALSATTSINAITDSVQAISEMNTHMATAAEQQSQVVAEINRNIHNIQEISENTVVGSNQIAGASEEIAQLSEDLRLQVQQFKVAS